jgi:hypothetical protein
MQPGVVEGGTAEQTLPQPPQLPLSVCSSTQKGLQHVPVVQSEAVAQLAPQAVVPHLYGAHGTVVGRGHAPLLQNAGSVWTPRAQPASTH